jgi:hypothetical protein
MSRFSRVSLVIIIMLLAVIALRPIVSPQPALAVSHYQYLVVTTPNASSAVIQQELDNRVAEGWELAASGYSEEPHGLSRFALIFRKEAR